MSLLTKIKALLGLSVTIDDDTVLDRVSSQLDFKPSTPLTLGIECEFGLFDKASFLPAHISLDVIDAVKDPFVHHELYLHMIEITTGVCADIHQAERDLAARLSLLWPELERRGADMVGVGSLPLLRLEQTQAVETERYAMLRQTRQALYERFTTLGMHIHIGMADSASCLRFHNFYMHFLPHLLALSASSPFEEGRDTGFASIRPSITESMPIGGIPYQFASWNEYRELCRAMARAGSITDLKDIWWDLRPCPRYGTLEIRICDQPSTLAEVTAIGAFVHALGAWCHEHQDWLEDMPRPNNWRTRENKWRVMRYGLDAELVTTNKGETRPIRDDIRQWMERLSPYYDRFGYDAHRATLFAVLARGNGAERQRRVFNLRNSLEDVYDHMAAELRHGSPLWDRIDQQKGRVE